MQNGAKCNSPILHPQLNFYILWAALKIMVNFARTSIHAIISFCFWICKPLKTSVKKKCILSIYLCIELRLSYHTHNSVSWCEPSTILLWVTYLLMSMWDPEISQQFLWHETTLLISNWQMIMKCEKKYLLFGPWDLCHCLELLISYGHN